MISTTLLFILFVAAFTRYRQFSCPRLLRIAVYWNDDEEKSLLNALLLNVHFLSAESIELNIRQLLYHFLD